MKAMGSTSYVAPVYIGLVYMTLGNKVQMLGAPGTLQSSSCSGRRRISLGVKLGESIKQDRTQK